MVTVEGKDDKRDSLAKALKTYQDVKKKNLLLAIPYV